MAAHGCKDAHPTRGGPSRETPGSQGRRPLGWRRDTLSCARNAVAIGGPGFPASPKRWITMSLHRGFRGASFSHRARNAGKRRSRVDFHFGKPRYREVPRCAGPKGPGVPRAPSRGMTEKRDYGRPGPQRTGALSHVCACPLTLPRYDPPAFPRPTGRNHKTE